MVHTESVVRTALTALLLLGWGGGISARAEVLDDWPTSVDSDPYYGYTTHPKDSSTTGLVPPGGEATFVAPEFVDPPTPSEPIGPVGEGIGLPPAVPRTFSPPQWHEGDLDDWHLLPGDVMFRSFIAGVHAPRMGGEIVSDEEQGLLLDVTIGSNVAVVRKGTIGPDAEGWELQVYAAALTRLGMDRQSDVEATDYKFGVPLVWKRGSTAVRIGYDHVSSHVGDEYLVRHPGFQRINYVRDSIALAAIQDVTDSVAVYGEVISAFHSSGGAGRWHFQFGAEYEPPVPAGIRGAPVAAVNTLIREEFDYEGSLGVVAGWQWRGLAANDLLRLGLSFYTGKSRQFSFYDLNETLIGAGLWYDF